MTRTLEWIKIKDILARWYVHDLGTPLEYVMNSCYISRRAKSKTCMLQTRFVEISSPVFTYHANRTTPREQKDAERTKGPSIPHTRVQLTRTCMRVDQWYDMRACYNKLLKAIRFRCDYCFLSNIGLQYIHWTALIFLVRGIYLQRSLNYINQAWTFASI